MMNFDSKLEMITLDITYNCNLRCLHCFNYSGEHNHGLKELSDEEILKICDDIIKLKPSGICLCGGEPLLRKDLVYKVIEKITKVTGYKTKINMVTNGELLDLNTAKKLKESGINAVQVSVDGCDSDTHDWMRNKGGIFDKAIKALEHLKQQKVTTFVSCTPSKRNINQIEELIELCSKLGVKQFRMQPLMLLGRAKQYLENELLNSFEYKKIPILFEKIKTEQMYPNMEFEWGSPLDHLKKEVRERSYRRFTLSINAYGYIVASPYIPLYVGNVREHSLIDYYNNGLCEVFNLGFVGELCDMCRTIESMDISNQNDFIPENYIDKSIDFDLINYNKADYINWDLDTCINTLREDGVVNV